MSCFLKKSLLTSNDLNNPLRNQSDIITNGLTPSKSDQPTTCNFEYSGALSEAVMLGVVSFQSQQAIEWDAANLKVKNDAGAQQLIHKEYRKGWTL